MWDRIRDKAICVKKFRSMKIVVIGTRGIPGIPGGVETHCEELYPRVAAMGNDVTVIRRSCYVKNGNAAKEYRGVRLCDVYAPKKKSLEAIVHTFLAVVRARFMNPDLLHVHAIGPSLMVPFARLLGMKVVMTNHGPDYDRDKWGKLAKRMLKAGEWAGTKFSNRVIVISKVIAGILDSRYGRKDTDLIFNGVTVPVKSKETDYIETLGLTPGHYILAVGRFVREKGFHDLIEAFAGQGYKNMKLVIAGDADHADEYSEGLKRQAADAGVVLTGYIKGEKLNQVMTNAALFVLPSYHEGLPIALLEAMSYDLDVVASDIPANRIDELNEGDFFHAGDVADLQKVISRKLKEQCKCRRYDLSRYDWDSIAAGTVEVYRQITGNDKNRKR